MRNNNIAIVFIVLLVLVAVTGVAIGQNQPVQDKPANPAPSTPVSPTPSASVPVVPQAVTPTPATPITPTPSAQPKVEIPEETPLPKDGITEKEISDLITKLFSDDLMVTNEARDELKEVGRPAVESLIKALANSKPEGRYRICEILGEIRDSRSVEILTKLLTDKDEHTASVASAAARALRNCADLSVIPYLMNVVTSTDINLRYEAIKTLGVLRAYQALPIIRLAITDTAKTSLGYYVNTAAVQAIGRLKDARSVKQLIPLLKSSDVDASDEPFVKYVIKSLEQITDYQTGSFSRSDDKKKDAVIKKWEEWWKKNKNNKDYE